MLIKIFPLDLSTVNNFLKTKVDERGAAIKLRQEEKKKNSSEVLKRAREK